MPVTLHVSPHLGTPQNLSDGALEPASPVAPALAGGFFTTEPSGKPY